MEMTRQELEKVWRNCKECESKSRIFFELMEVRAEELYGPEYLGEQ